MRSGRAKSTLLPRFTLRSLLVAALLGGAFAGLVLRSYRGDVSPGGLSFQVPFLIVVIGTLAYLNWLPGEPGRSARVWARRISLVLACGLVVGFAGMLIELGASAPGRSGIWQRVPWSSLGFLAGVATAAGYLVATRDKGGNHADG